MRLRQRQRRDANANSDNNIDSDSDNGHSNSNTIAIAGQYNGPDIYPVLWLSGKQLLTTPAKQTPKANDGASELLRCGLKARLWVALSCLSANLSCALVGLRLPTCVEFTVVAFGVVANWVVCASGSLPKSFVLIWQMWLSDAMSIVEWGLISYYYIILYVMYVLNLSFMNILVKSLNAVRLFCKCNHNCDCWY